MLSTGILLCFKCFSCVCEMHKDVDVVLMLYDRVFWHLIFNWRQKQRRPTNCASKLNITIDIRMKKRRSANKISQVLHIPFPPLPYQKRNSSLAFLSFLSLSPRLRSSTVRTLSSSCSNLLFYSSSMVTVMNINFSLSSSYLTLKWIFSIVVRQQCVWEWPEYF